VEADCIDIPYSRKVCTSIPLIYWFIVCRCVESLLPCCCVFLGSAART